MDETPDPTRPSHSADGQAPLNGQVSAKAITVRRLTKKFGDFTALSDINFDVDYGEKIIVCGPSGSGKSTLIRCLNQLETHDDGEIFVNSVQLKSQMKNVEAVRRDVGMVFQSFNLFPHLTVLENCLLAQRLVLKRSVAEARDVALGFLERVRIPEQAGKYPRQLSGGQQQRVAIAGIYWRACWRKQYAAVGERICSSQKTWWGVERFVDEMARATASRSTEPIMK